MTGRARELRRYDRSGALALQRSAFFDLFLEAEDTANEQLAGVTVVTIRGPLDHHAGWWCDSYEAILERVAVACRAPAPVVLLRIDSPGGQVSGMLDAARQIRARAEAAGKRLVAYVDGCACSAGYALASSAERIYASSTAFVGSVGILITRVDVSARDAAEGTRYALVASGSRKTDGNAHTALSEDELANMSRECESLASLFFEAVAMLRPQLTVDALRALDAGVFHGPAAVQAGLVDQLASFDEALAALSGGTMEDQNEQTEERTAGPLDDAREALERAADGDGDEAERARRALEILNGGGGSEDEPEEQAASARSSTGATARAARAAAP
ncbi:MAG TPA: S49 family peptidase, partial [Anaeromyxobacteraceae bacterium]|nr:S49 family peptidase [Anaeromyxobacteraceae bacterium]